VGLWVDDVNEMDEFLTNVMGLRLLTHVKGERGERVFVLAGDSQMIELLWTAERQPRPNVPHHREKGGSGAVVGIPHLCLRVTDLPAWEKHIRSLHYTVHLVLPESGYIGSEIGTLRAMWFTGPSGLDIELFEFEEEISNSQLAA
jgi:catechol 2,3-dioxygenase-like lactoylglutathione lyase family enzyme